MPTHALDTRELKMLISQWSHELGFQQMGVSDIDLAQAAAVIFFILGLELAGEVVIGLIGNDGKAIDRWIEDPFAVLIHWQTQTSPDLLAFAIL